MSETATTCLVIGGTGYVGSAVARAAREVGWQVTAVGRDDYAGQVGKRFDVVINANGNASRFKANQEPAWDFGASVSPVVASLSDFKFDRYALISTVDVYNDPADADRTAESTPIDAESLCPYGLHKRLAELCVMQQAPRWLVFRLAQMVGSNLKKGPLFDVLERQPLWIHPKTRLHYMNTLNVGSAVIHLLQNAPSNEIYNVCGRGSVPFSEVLAMFDEPYCDVTYAQSEQQTYSINTDKTHAMLPLPESRDEIRAFVDQAMAATR